MRSSSRSAPQPTLFRCVGSSTSLAHSFPQLLSPPTTEQRWIHEIEEEEPTGFIVYDKFEALAVRLMTEEAMSNKRNTEDEILEA